MTEETLDDARERGAEVERHVTALGGYQAAVAALAEVGISIRWESLWRYVKAAHGRGTRTAPDEILEALRRLAADSPRWIVGRDEQQRRWIVHLHRPRFAARIVDGGVGQVEWLDAKPDAHRHGRLVAEAETVVAGVKKNGKRA